MTAACAAQIDRLLPQTQCRECGYDGCLPYAQALAAGEAAVNLCTPGGEAVMRDIAGLLGKPPLAPVKIQTPALAWIDEAACIGCTACIRACPVDAIMGASKLMHTVIAAECTGCGLCVAPCPVDCIHMRPSENSVLPQACSLAAPGLAPRFAAAAHARARWQNRETRKSREAEEKQAERAAKEAAVRQTCLRPRKPDCAGHGACRRATGAAQHTRQPHPFPNAANRSRPPKSRPAPLPPRRAIRQPAGKSRRNRMAAAASGGAGGGLVAAWV